VGEVVSGAGKSIFVVDDDAMMLNLLRRILETAGYGVRAFSAPDECLAAVPVGDPDCIVSDLQMPGMDGAQLIRELRRLGHPVPVIIATAAVSPSIQISEARRAGAYRILAKPSSRSEVLDAIAGATAAPQGADRIGRHLLEYRQLLDHEEARLQVLANAAEGLERAELEIRLRALVDERKRLDETLVEYLGRVDVPGNQLRPS
jgi:CheY-like chemotaxis protein